MTDDVLLLLAITSARRLFGLRNGVHGAHARKDCRYWVGVIRKLRTAA